MTTITPTPTRPPAVDRPTGATTLGEMVMRAAARGDAVALRYPDEHGVAEVTYGELADARGIDRSRADRARRRARGSRLRSSAPPAPSGRSATSERCAPARWWRRSTTPTRRPSASTSWPTPRRAWCSARTPTQAAKIAEIRDTLPRARARRRVRRRRGRRRDDPRRAVPPRRGDRRARRPGSDQGGHGRRPRDARVHVGHHRAGEGLHAHPRELPRDARAWSATSSCSTPCSRVIYMFLPLAHVLAQATQAVVLDVGGTIVYWGGDPARIVEELAACAPTHFPAVPRIYEKMHTAMASTASRLRIPLVGGAVLRWAVAQGRRARLADRAPDGASTGRRAPSTASPTGSCSARSDACSAAGCVMAIVGAAPIAPDLRRVLRRMRGARCSRATG